MYTCSEPMVIWGGFSGTPLRYIPNFTMVLLAQFLPTLSGIVRLHCNCMEFGFNKGSKVESHRVNAGNDLGGELGHDDDDDAGQQPGLQEQGLRVELASWDFPPGQSRELGRGIRQGFSRGLSSAWPRRRRGKQRRPDKL